MTTDRSPRWLRRALLAGGGVSLALVFMAYQDPHTVVDLANRVWACF
jgi:hypothetical protein